MAWIESDGIALGLLLVLSLLGDFVGRAFASTSMALVHGLGVVRGRLPPPL